MTPRSLVVLGLLAGIFMVPSPSHAQLCPGSWLKYIVRHAGGSAVDAAADSFTFQGGTGNTSWLRNWQNRYEAYRFELIPAELRDEVEGRVSPLALASMCVFMNGATLRLTMSGKVMDLTFNIAPPCCNASKNYVVDGLPFQEGRFEIAIPVPDGQHAFVPAKAWRRSR